NIYQNYVEQKKLAAVKAFEAEQQAMAQQANAAAKIAAAESQIEREKNYLRNKRQALSLRKRHATGGSSEGEALDEAFSAHMELLNSANKFRVSCCSGEDEAGNFECRNMAAFLG